jgi:sulfite exporter TauE/SafE
MAFALIPCPPMAGILVYSLNMPSVIGSSLLMLLFGLGTAFSPLFIIFVLSGWFSNRLKANVPQYKMMFQRIAGTILIFLGGSYLSGSP